MTPETQAAAERVRAFLDAYEDPDQSRGAISTLRTEGLRLTPLDLRLLLAAADQLDAAAARTIAKMREYAAHGSGTVNVRQVINLLSPTWPDGNYEATAPDGQR